MRIFIFIEGEEATPRATCSKDAFQNARFHPEQILEFFGGKAGFGNKFKELYQRGAIKNRCIHVLLIHLKYLS